MRRYYFLSKDEVYDALNRLRDAFLAAKDGNDVNEIINGLLTHDEKMKIGRRIIISEHLDDFTTRELADITHVGNSTIIVVAKSMSKHPKCFELISKRRRKLEKDYESKKYISRGGSTLVFKKKEYTGIKRADIKR